DVYKRQVELQTTGGPLVPLTSRLLPMLVMYAVLIAGLFIPAASLVEEREKKTIDAVLVTPVQMPDFLAGKAGLGIILAMATGVMTLILNNAFGVNPGALLVVLFLASLMSAEFGLILGSVAKDANTLFTFIKSIGIVLVAPVIFFIWPGLPQWIAKIFPTYYFLSPVYEVAINDSTLGQVAFELAIGFAICAALVPIVLFFGRRMVLKLGAS
ncbi:MAG TPA: ABC transporter permease, partial [Actinobacteria bacterium]|nr:ABC transporter permease [Actinomycetota bacterium]